MAGQEAQTRVGELSPEDRERLQKLETKVEFVIEKIGVMADSVTELSGSVNKMTVNMARHADNNHHIADKLDKVNDRVDKLEDRTFGKDGLSDEFHDMESKTNVNTAQTGTLIALALLIIGSIGGGIYIMISFMSKQSELQNQLIQTIERLQ